MDTCFVIQPFDKERYDQRYIDTFEPAIKAAGFTPYRVDRDASVRIPIQNIEEEIRKSRICFAEITKDNPNVWYELGFAFANNKEVVMVTEERGSFPFDIQHRHIIVYKTNSKSDYEALEKQICDKLKALIAKDSSIEKIINNPVADSNGLTQSEITLMFILLENQVSDMDTVSHHSILRDMDAAGFTRAAVNISTRLLKSKKLILQLTEYDQHDGEGYTVFKLTEDGEKWVIDNMDKIKLIK